MAILKDNFINRKKLKLTLDTLTKTNFMFTHSFKNKKVYWPNLCKIIKATDKFKNNERIKTIMNINPLTWIH